MKQKFFAYALLPMLGLSLLGPGVASAMGFGFGGFGNATPDQIATRQQTMFQNEADLLGINVDEVKNGWAQGKSIVQIAEEHGITKEQLQQKMQDARSQQLKAQMQALVDKGIITQAQADQRLQFMQSRTQNQKGHRGMGMGFRGMHF